MKIFGLTGGVASGKSSVARRLRDRGARVIDADAVARAVVAPGTEGLFEIVRAFGPEVLSGGSLDRAAMRRRIVADPAARATLEHITHPRIADAITTAIAEAAADGVEVVVVEAALMVETGTWRRYPDGVITVRVDPTVQLARLLGRDGGAETDAARLIATQASQDEKVRIARFVLDNNGATGDLDAQVDALWDQMRG